MDEIGIGLAKAGAVGLLSDTHDDTLILGQIQRLQGLEYAILIHGIDFDGHTLLYAGRRQPLRPASPRATVMGRREVEEAIQAAKGEPVDKQAIITPVLVTKKNASQLM